MILPNKYVALDESLFGLGALVFDILQDKALTTDKIWTSFQKKFIKTGKLSNPPTFQKFILVLMFMFMCEMISYNDKGELINENIRASH